METENNINFNSQPIEEAPKKQSNKSKIAIIVLAIVTLAGIGFGGFMFCQNSKNNTEIKNLKTEITKLESGDLQYEKYANALIKGPEIGVFGYYPTGDTLTNKALFATIKNGHLKIESVEDEKTILEEDGYIGVYFVEIGDGSDPYFYLITKDGSVSKIDISGDSKYKIEPLEKYSKIVSVFGGGDLNAWLVDIHGNIYKDPNFQ